MSSGLVDSAAQPDSTRPMTGQRAPQLVLQKLRETIPWTRILSIAALSWSAIIGLGAMALLVMGLSGTGRITVVLLGFFYALIALIYAIPAIALFRYSRGIEAAVAQQSATAVQRAFRQHRTFWFSSGIVITLVAIVDLFLFANSVAIPAYSRATARSKLRRTVTNVRTVGEALEQFAHDRHQYPDAKTVAELSRFLVPEYLSHVPATDGWGRPLQYQTRCSRSGCYDFVVLSLGSDGEAEWADPRNLFGLGTPGDIWNPERDISLEEKKTPPTLQQIAKRDVIYGNGRFVRVPSGMDKK
jgi:hypothetical protein